MINSAKLTKETTLVIDDYSYQGDRIVDLRLRPPHKADYANEESAITFVGGKVEINLDVLQKYGIEVEYAKTAESEANKEDEEEKDL